MQVSSRAAPGSIGLRPRRGRRRLVPPVAHVRGQSGPTVSCALTGQLLPFSCLAFAPSCSDVPFFMRSRRLISRRNQSPVQAAWPGIGAGISWLL